MNRTIEKTFKTNVEVYDFHFDMIGQFRKEETHICSTVDQSMLDSAIFQLYEDAPQRVEVYLDNKLLIYGFQFIDCPFSLVKSVMKNMASRN